MKNLLLSSLIAASLLLSACSFSGETNEESLIKSIPVHSGVIDVSGETIMDNEIGEPIGHRVIFSGAYNESFDYIFPEESNDTEADWIDGDRTSLNSYFFAGIDSSLVYVNDGGTLQFLITEQEEGTVVMKSEILDTFEIPDGVEFTFTELIE